MINFKYLPILAIATGLLGSPALLSAQTSAGTPSGAATGASAQAAKDAASSVQQLKAKFSAQRQALISQHQDLLKRLKAAKSSVERQKILNEAQKKNKALVTSQHDQAKQIQNDIKEQEQIQHDEHHGPPGFP